MTALPKLPRTAPDMVKAIYNAAARRHEDLPGPRKFLRMSAIGGCERNLWAELHGIPNERPFEGRICVLFEQGDTVEALVVRCLKLAGYDVDEVDPETGRQFELEGLGGLLRGHTDGRIKVGR